jgi:hypothetical protein
LKNKKNDSHKLPSRHHPFKIRITQKGYEKNVVVMFAIMTFINSGYKSSNSWLAILSLSLSGIFFSSLDLQNSVLALDKLAPVLSKFVKEGQTFSATN